MDLSDSLLHQARHKLLPKALPQPIGRVGEAAATRVENAVPDVVSSDCPLAGLQLKQKTGRPVYHPVRILQAAYRGEPLRSPKGDRGGDLPPAEET